jgi:hypothetical protein
MNDVIQIPNAQVAVASIGLQPKFRYIGTNSIPPPSPNPVRIPALTLFMTSSVILLLNSFGVSLTC